MFVYVYVYIKTRMMDLPHIMLIGFYSLLVMLNVYTTRTISADENAIQELRKFNVHTWTL